MDKTQHSSKKTLHNGLYAAALAVVVLAAVILVNLVVRALPYCHCDFPFLFIHAAHRL